MKPEKREGCLHFVFVDVYVVLKNSRCELGSRDLTVAPFTLTQGRITAAIHSLDLLFKRCHTSMDHC